MKIPIFVSAPSDLNPKQEKVRSFIAEELEQFRLEWRALGRSDYPTDLPLLEVSVLATHCSGGLILGFEQCFIEKGIRKRGVLEKEKAATNLVFPTPWNHLEAGVLFGLGLPLLVFREDGIDGGIFDVGVSDVFVHKMPPPDLTEKKRMEIRDVFLKWQARVREHYYRDKRLASICQRI
jgi:hypothetical protein